jgi:hypothetical protein
VCGVQHHVPPGRKRDVRAGPDRHGCLSHPACLQVCRPIALEV